MAIQIIKLGEYHWRLQLNWPKGQRIIINLKLTDPDGDVDEREVRWRADQDISAFNALDKIVELIEPLPHWTARRRGSEIKIEPSSDDYTGEVTFDVS